MRSKEEVFKAIKNLIPEQFALIRSETTAYSSLVKNCLDEYLIIVHDLRKEDRPSNWAEIIHGVKAMKRAIMETVSLISKGLRSRAYETLKIELDKNVFSFIQFDKNSTFFRMREFKVGEMIKAGRKELFHIPMNKRNLVKTERFSAPGYPCLYLGKSCYGCWEEMDRPHLDSCMVSRISNAYVFRSLDFSFSDYGSWEKDFEKRVVSDQLILVSRLSVGTRDDSFRIDYAIPQLIMEWIIEQNSKTKDRKKFIWGVYYESSHKNEQFEFPEKVFYNLAIPVIQANNEQGACPILKDCFRMTKPTCAEYEEIRRRDPALGISIEESLEPENGDDERMERYKMSLFGFLEDRLSNSILFPLGTIENY